jgi:hypothetical protein
MCDAPKQLETEMTQWHFHLLGEQLSNVAATPSPALHLYPPPGYTPLTLTWIEDILKAAVGPLDVCFDPTTRASLIEQRRNVLKQASRSGYATPTTPERESGSTQ